jgi:gliding motility-associated-like protein
MNVILPNACNGNPNQPNLRFSIEKTDGTVLQSYNSGNIPSTSSPVWNQYGFFFTTPPAGSDIVLRIFNNAPGGCGNDLALDDITFRPCGPKLTPSIVGQSALISNICEGASLSYTFNCTVTAGFSNPAFQWQKRTNTGAWTNIPGVSSTTLIANFPASTPAGTYEYRLSVAEAGNMGYVSCNISSLPVTVVVNPIPLAAASSNGPICSGGNLQLNATGGSEYSWNGPNGFSFSGASASLDAVQNLQAGMFEVLVTSAQGCSMTAQTTVVVNPSPIAGTSFTEASICLKDSVRFVGSGGGSYQWTPPNGLSSSLVFNPTASPDSTTKYRLVVSNNYLCKDTAYINLVVNSKAIADAGADKTLILGSSTTLNGSISGPYLRFDWTPKTELNNPFLLQPLALPSTNAQYVLMVESNNGCGFDSDTVLIKLYNDIYIPTAFTPNNDGINDSWHIPALDAYPDMELSVFNRYGEVVFKTSHTNTPWNGRYKSDILPSGVYPYIIKLHVNNQIIKGKVMLIH